MDNSRNLEPNTEPIAIIGIGCRFPGGATGPEEFWRVLRDGVDGVCDVPSDRWDLRRFYDEDPDRPGKMYTRMGGFLREPIDEFDPLFFGISPREAHTMDPQQRLLLEVTWQAIEDAGLDYDALKGSPAGVFVGGFCLDSKLMQLNLYNRNHISSHTATGGTMAILANRISYIYDFRGPSITMDTACSSSLSATYVACRSLWMGDCDLAFVGGVNVMTIPEYPIAMSKGKFLSTHGKCMTFDARAEGYTRGEGAGIAILKPLSRAIADGDTIYSVIRGVGANQDGHTSGMPLPNPQAQEDLIRDVYAKAQVSPGEIAFVEAHGTGTRAGDKTEAEALNNIFKDYRTKDNPVYVGSVKTNIGHLEAGAGVAGLIKAALSLHHGKVPPNLHYETPNPEIDFEKMVIKVADSLVDMPMNGKPRLASINSFGYGGANVHVLLEEYRNAGTGTGVDSADATPSTAQAFRADRPRPVLVSARSEEALIDLATSYAAVLRGGGVSYDDFVYSVNRRRSGHTFRSVILSSSPENLAESLDAVAEGAIRENVFSDRLESEPSESAVFVYTGMGPQWFAMGRRLYAEEPVYRRCVDECDRVFTEVAGFSILEEMMKEETDSNIGRTSIAQPANFVLQAGLTELLASWGYTPGAVVGHSVGEVAAAYAAGILSLHDAALVSYHRSRLQEKTAGGGTMLALGIGQEEAEGLIEDFDTVDLAAVNSSSSVTISGEREALEAIAEIMEENEIFNRFLRVEVAYHSYQMEPIRDEFLKCLEEMNPRVGSVPYWSTVTCSVLDGKNLDASYWWRNVREPVKFGETFANLMDDSETLFLQVGPHPVLSASMREMITADSGVSIVSTLTRKEDEVKSMLAAVAGLINNGLLPEWSVLIPEGSFVKLPFYPFQREKYWKESERSKEDKHGIPGHVFINNDLRQPDPTYEIELNTQFLPYLEDHRIEGSVIFPGAAYTEAALALYNKVTGEERCCLEDVAFHQVLAIDPSRIQRLRMTYEKDTSRFSVHSRFEEDDPSFTLHASGRAIPLLNAESEPEIDLGNLSAGCTEQVDVDELYNFLDHRGLNYGPHFQAMKKILRGPDQVLVEIRGLEDPTENGYFIHPTILDATFQSLVAIIDTDNSGGSPYIPVSIDAVYLYRQPGISCRSFAVINDRRESSVKGDITIFDESGTLAVEVRGIKCQAISRPMAVDETEWNRNYYSFDWIETDTAPEVDPVDDERVLLFVSDKDGSGGDGRTAAASVTPLTEVLRGALSNRGAEVLPVYVDFGGDIEAQVDNLIRESDAALPRRVVFACSIGRSTHPDTAPDAAFEIGYSTLVSRFVSMVSDSDDSKGEGTNAADSEDPQTDTAGARIDLTIVTNGLFAIPAAENGTIHASAGSVWGLGQLISNEFPDVVVRCVDVSTEGGEIDRAADEILGSTPEMDIALRNGSRFTRVLQSTELVGEEDVYKSEEADADTECIFLDQEVPGQVGSLIHRRSERVAPGPEEFEMQIYTSSINFKDLLKIRGELAKVVSDNTFSGEGLGMECCGRVVRVGENVTRFKEGDVVFGTVQESFRTYATLHQDLVVRKKPDLLDINDAPIAVPFFTAYYSLIELARLREGDRVLIHSASGAVGLCAVQIAQWKRAEIFATAGNEEKREYLREIGCDYVMNSRTLDFYDEILKITDGEGIDVVLNAVAGETLLKSYQLLRPYGRFVEIGKRDISMNTGLPMGKFNDNVSFHGFDMDRILIDRPQVVYETWEKIVDGLEEGYFKPLPTAVYPASEIVEAFRFMTTSRHIGKIVIRYKGEKVPVRLTRADTDYLEQKATYLITGGTRGLGLEIAEWLSRRSAARVVLVSRSGLKTEESKQVVTRMRGRNTQVKAVALDVTDGAAVEDLIAEIHSDELPLKGIFHCAMVLDDGYLKDMNRERYHTVLMPKVAGAINLHNATLGLPLDLFVSFSSISALIGNAGQANYVAANHFLDVFAGYRRSMGLAATTVNLGVVADVGVVARSENLNDYFKVSGIRGFDTAEVLEGLDFILEKKPAQIGFFDVDWEKWGAISQRAARSSRFAELMSHAREMGKGSGKLQELLDTLAEIEESARVEYLVGLLRGALSGVLHIPPENLDLNLGINNMGIDSLMVVELQAAINNEFGLELTSMELLKGPSLNQLGRLLYGKIQGQIGEGSGGDVDSLSEEQLDELLGEMVEQSE